MEFIMAIKMQSIGFFIHPQTHEGPHRVYYQVSHPARHFPLVRRQGLFRPVVSCTPAVQLLCINSEPTTSVIKFSQI